MTSSPHADGHTGAPDAWAGLRRWTAARVALGRAGSSLSTADWLAFRWSHAMARDAVHEPMVVQALVDEIAARPWTAEAAIAVHSAAADRARYLLRPDLGRRLDDASAAALDAARPPNGFDLLFVVADGLSSAAAMRHALPLIDAFHALPGAADRRIAPIVVAGEARVALGDEIGERLGARLVAVLIGERPGLSSPDSLGVYLTHAPRVGRRDAERNCISNVRPDGLPPALAARRLAWLCGEALQRRLTGVGLKDGSDDADLGRIESQPMEP